MHPTRSRTSILANSVVVPSIWMEIYPEPRAVVVPGLLVELTWPLRGLVKPITESQGSVGVLRVQKVTEVESRTFTMVYSQMSLPGQVELVEFAPLVAVVTE